jgi:cell division protein FtsB
MKFLRSLDKRILVIVGVIVLILLMLDFNSRMADLSRLKNQRDKLSTQDAQLVQTEQFLDTRIAYATSDVAVQDFARNNGKMIQPGDILLVPLSPGDRTPQTTPFATSVTVQVDNWQRWFALFFGQ